MVFLRVSLVRHARLFSTAAKMATPAFMHTHQQAVERISASVKAFYDRKEKFRIFHGSTNSTRQTTKHKNVVDTSALSRILHIDTNAQTVLVEPNVPMDRLVEETMKHGLVPPVVMEFPGITVGGGYSGTSGESSSFKHGFFNQTINSVEMVLANGDITKCSDSEKPDLFRGAAGAVGSIGVTTLVELQLRRAAKFVETTYYPIKGMAEATQKLLEATQDSGLDYVDGIMFSRSEGVIVTGRMTDTPLPNSKVQRFSGANDPWFYLHAQDLVRDVGKPVTEAIPMAEYLFRYDRGGFWVGTAAFDYFMMPFNKFTRWWLDDFLHTRMMYTALHASGQSKKVIIQDLALPFSTVEEFVDYTDTTFGIYPLWLCPLKQDPLPTMHPQFNETEADGSTLKPMLNVGLWGWGPPTADEFIRKNKDLEQKLRELGGMKWLYAQTYYSEDEFWSMYDRQWYDQLREKYDAVTLPSVYDKVKIDPEVEKNTMRSTMTSALVDKWPFSGLYGIKAAIDSGSYLQARTSTWRSTGETDRFGINQ